MLWLVGFLFDLLTASTPALDIALALAFTCAIIAGDI